MSKFLAAIFVLFLIPLFLYGVSFLSRVVPMLTNGKRLSAGTLYMLAVGLLWMSLGAYFIVSVLYDVARLSSPMVMRQNSLICLGYKNWNGERVG